MKYYLQSRFNDKGNVFAQIWEEDEIDCPTPAYAEHEGYDEYWDEFGSLEEAEQAKRDALAESR
jgi:hypothetical protein